MPLIVKRALVTLAGLAVVAVIVAVMVAAGQSSNAQSSACDKAYKTDYFGPPVSEADYCKTYNQASQWAANH